MSMLHRGMTSALRREVRMRRYRQLLFLNSQLHDPADPLTKYTNTQFYKIFRLSKESFRDLLSMIEEDLQRSDNRGRPLPPVYQLLIALHFYCSGSYQKVVGEHQSLQVSQPTVCRTIHRVSESLARRYSQFVTFPSLAQAPHIHSKFYELGSFPNVIGAIDCIHMRISNPGGTMTEQCRNRSGWYSVNCQVVAGPDLRILTAIVRWGGGVPDHQIYQTSRVKRVLEQGEYGHLVGDEGYQCQRYLLTPVPSSSTPADICYNRALAATHAPVKQVFGLLRKQFQCTRHELRSNPKTSCAIILSCFALHNFILERHGPPNDNWDITITEPAPAGYTREGQQERYTEDKPQERYEGDWERDRYTENGQWNKCREDINQGEFTDYGMHDRCRENSTQEEYMEHRPQDGRLTETRKKAGNRVNQVLKNNGEDSRQDRAMESGTQVRYIENRTEDQYIEVEPQERYTGEEDTEGESYRQHIIHEWFSHDNVP
ncbi:hypothetical protein Pmani_037197 [Petrolisthes manimaculis]|uniref:Putative nuclease HARBI1 n=1 Tax=Petrolisthes manimaculis TaxID=1843537 RepID=A0AAE1NGR8_9EUCA|nr:hypothetical protein Pmani_037197 [Petrolisthes manimaculis]